MVTEQQSGLRFDIYERVHLADGVVGIGELEEVELVPHIQVVSRDEQAVLRGNLLLTGIYEGEAAAGQRKLEHLIPVEITLPLNRIHRVEDIAVEIENFDIDLLSPRSLNVTGVLSLRGIEMISPVAEPSWNEEEVVFLHQVREEPSVPQLNEQKSDPWLQQEGPTAFQQTDESNTFKHRAETDGSNDFAAWAQPANRAEAAEGTAEGTAERAKSKEAAAQSSEKAVELTQHVEPEAAEAPEGASEFVDRDEIEQETVIMEEAKSLAAAEEDEKAGMKIAFGSKKNEDAGFSGNPLSSILQKLGGKETETRQETAAPSTEPEEQPSSADALEWKKLFISSDSGEGQFRRVRMCIVQKEETLDIIAERYQLNPREIMLYNRLSSQTVSEGQIIYIPK